MFDVANAPAAGIVNVDSPQTVGDISFNNSSGTPYTISGSSLTLATGSVTVTGTTNEVISAPQIISASAVIFDIGLGRHADRHGQHQRQRPLSKINSGTLALGGTNSYTGGTVIGAGNVKLLGTGVVPAVPAGAVRRITRSTPSPAPW